MRWINLGIRGGKLAAVVGMVGSGKSSLPRCILGEMRKVSCKGVTCMCYSWLFPCRMFF